MGCTRAFMGWDTPAIEGVVRALGGPAGPSSFPGHGAPLWDLSGIVVGAPTSRFGRRLLERLAETAQDPGQPRALVPPEVAPIGALGEVLWPRTSHVATALEEQLAWIAAVRAQDPDYARALLPVPDHRSPSAWLPLADMLIATRRTLVLENRSLAEVARAVARSGPEREAARWRLVVQIEESFLHALRSAGRTPRDTPPDAGPGLTRRVVLAACSTLPASLVAGLRRAGPSVTTLAHAPEAEADGFDDLGCLRADYWCDRLLDLPSDHILTGGTVREQAAIVCACIAEVADQYGADDVTVCLGDPSAEGILRLMLNAAGVRMHHAFHRPLALSGPARLLGAIADFAETRSFEALAALVRHPDLEPGLHHTRRLAALDQYVARSLPDRLARRAEAGQVSDDALARAARSVAADVETLLGGLRPGTKTIAEWAEPVARTLAQVYDPVLDSAPGDQAPVLAALDAIADWLRDASNSHPSLAAAMPMSAAQALRFMSCALADVSAPEATDEPAVEALDWFETAHDDAPVKIVLGVNEGLIPEGPSRDPLLSDALRAELGMPDGRAKFARDVHHLTALLASTSHARFIVGRTSAAGDALAPSRLLFACPDTELPDRAKGLFSPDRAQPVGPRAALPFQFGAESRLGPRRPEPPADPVSRLPVTGFRDYLACPYRFYLRHVMRLRSDDDRLVEMDAALFGSLIHEALGIFGAGESAGATDPRAVASALDRALDTAANARFGQHPRPAVRLQIGQARRRLDAFAAWQAARSAQGWRLVTEWTELDAQTDIAVDGAPFTVYGRIDRIERNLATGEYAILDYKTGDTLTSPVRAHLSSDAAGSGWVDLQLPLYRRIAPLPDDATVRLGFLWIGPDLGAESLHEANWGPDDIRSAYECADGVVRAVRAGVFWPPNPAARHTGDGIGAICLESSAGRAAWPAVGHGG
jgi:hypothetical protein